jgi:hypothetical protein
MMKGRTFLVTSTPHCRRPHPVAYRGNFFGAASTELPVKHYSWNKD